MYTVEEFSKRIKNKYPAYKNMDDNELAQKVVNKYPVYKSQVDFNKQKDPTFTEGVTEGIKSGWETAKQGFENAGNAIHNGSGSALDRTGAALTAGFGGVAGGLAKGVGGVVGAAFETADDMTGETVSRNFNEYVTPQIQKGVQYAMNTDVGKKAIAEYQEAMKDPTSRAYLEGTLGLVDGALTLSGGGKLAKTAGQGAISGARGGLNVAKAGAVGSKNLAVKTVKAPINLTRNQLEKRKWLGFTDNPQDLVDRQYKIASEILQEGNKATSMRNSQFSNASMQLAEEIKNFPEVQNINTYHEFAEFANKRVGDYTKQVDQIIKQKNVPVDETYLQQLLNNTINLSNSKHTQAQSLKYQNILFNEFDDFKKIKNPTLMDLQRRKKELGKYVNSLYGNSGLKKELNPDQLVEKQAFDDIRAGLQKEIERIGGAEVKALNRKSSALIDARTLLRVQRERANKANTGVNISERGVGENIVGGIKYTVENAPVIGTGGGRKALTMLETQSGMLENGLNKRIKTIQKNQQSYLKSRTQQKLNQQPNVVKKGSKLKQRQRQDLKLNRKYSYNDNKTQSLASQGIAKTKSGKVVGKKYKTGDTHKKLYKNSEISNMLVGFKKGLSGIKNKTIKTGDILSINTNEKTVKLLGAEKIILKQSTLRKKLKEHNLNFKDIENLDVAMQKPLLVYKSGTRAKRTVVITPLSKGRNKIAVALDKGNKKFTIIAEIKSIHPKDLKRLQREYNAGKVDVSFMDKRNITLDVNSASFKKKQSHQGDVKNIVSSKNKKVKQLVKSGVSKIKSSEKKKALIERFKKSKNLQDFLKSVKSNKLTKLELAAIYNHLQNQKENNNKK